MSLKKKRNKQILGYFLILLGIAIPLYGFTGLTKSILADKSGYEKFSNIEVDKSTRDREEERIIKYNVSLEGMDTTIVDPFATDDFKTKYEISADPDEIFAYLRIPKLELLQPIRLDASSKHMAKGLAHVDGTSLPVGGIGNRSVIAGHRGYYQSIMFLNLDELETGDAVFIERNKKVLEYKVVNKEIINPSQWQKLNPIDGKDMLTLLTCDPLLPPRPHRLLVNCERLVEEKNHDKLNDVEEQVVDVSPKAKFRRNLILITTMFGWLLLFFALYRFVRFLRK